MNTNLKILVISLLSGAGGFYMGYNLGKKKYENLADREVESVRRELKDIYEKKSPVPEISPAGESEEVDRPLDEIQEEYRDYAKQYSSEANGGGERIVGIPKTIEKKLTKEEIGHDGPYVISENDYKESYYEAKTLYYYKDKVLADEDYNEILDVDDRVGDENLVRIGMDGLDYIYVRNDKLEIDYEIMIDERYFEQSAPRKTVIPED